MHTIKAQFVEQMPQIVYSFGIGCALQNFRNDNIHPYYKIGGKVIYDEAEIKAWLNANYHPRY